MFDELALDRQLRLGLAALPFDAPTEVQQRVVPAALAGQDLIVSAETGSGKTLAYLVPLAQRILSSASPEPGTLALVLVPTRELARQVLKQCTLLFAKSPLQAEAITGGVEFRYQKALLRKDPQVVIATPGRLLEHLQKGSIDFTALQTLVLDEADRMLDLGLRNEVLAIARSCPHGAQRLLLSATLSHRGIPDLTGELLDSAQTITIGEQRRAHASITHQLILADSQGHKDNLLRALLESAEINRALVFGNKRSTAIRLAKLLADTPVRCDCLHGDLSTEERKAVMQRFHEGKVNVLCASDVAARGLDIPDIDAVINYDVPHSGDDYVHRTGRTGRAGAVGVAISLASAAEWKQVNSIEKYLSLQFEQRSIPGLKARYDGSPPGGTRPGRGRSSGKESTTESKSERHASRPRPGSSSKAPNDGFAPLRKKGPKR